MTSVCGWRCDYQSNLPWTAVSTWLENQLCLKVPRKKVEIPAHYRGKSFALKARVRHVSEEAEPHVRTVVQVFDKATKHDFFAWGSIKVGTPFFEDSWLGLCRSQTWLGQPSSLQSNSHKEQKLR